MAAMSKRINMQRFKPTAADILAVRAMNLVEPISASELMLATMLGEHAHDLDVRDAHAAVTAVMGGKEDRAHLNKTPTLHHKLIEEAVRSGFMMVTRFDLWPVPVGERGHSGTTGIKLRRGRRLLDMLTRATVKVGRGVGFVVQDNGERQIITASSLLERPGSTATATYENLVGPLGRRKPTISATARFVGDLALLSGTGEAFKALILKATPLKPAKAKRNPAAYVLRNKELLRLKRDDDGNLYNATVIGYSAGKITDTPKYVDASPGSPIVNFDGDVIAVCGGGHGPPARYPLKL
jgi:hypothetical protein